jgi:hypothetical protein
VLVRQQVALGQVVVGRRGHRCVGHARVGGVGGQNPRIIVEQGKVVTFVAFPGV